MSRTSRVTRPCALLAGVLVCLGSAFAQVASPGPHSSMRFTEEGSRIGDFRFIERSGREVGLEDLLGQPWIGVPFFRGCTGPCPSLTSDLHTAFRERLAGSGVRVVSFTLDADEDTPSALRSYAEEYHIESEEWLFLSGPDKGALQEYVRGQLGVPVAESVAAGFEYGQSITHGTRLPVIDPEGRIAGWYECARANFGDVQSFEASVGALVDRARALRTRPKTALPLINAVLNGLAFVLLLAGMRAIHAGARERHALLMRSAFVVSATFLACYLYYHLVVQAGYGPTPFHAEGPARIAYLLLLASHVVLAMVNLPMVLRTFWLAHKQDWERHRWWARKTLPLWLYVSITGVFVYVVLYHLNPTP